MAKTLKDFNNEEDNEGTGKIIDAINKNNEDQDDNDDEACWKAATPVYGIDFELSAY